MKKIIFTLLIMIVTPVMVSASVPVLESINVIENNLFGYDYANESNSERIERIEKHLYGAKKTGNIDQRIKDIQNDIGYVAPAVPKQDKKASRPFLKEDSSVEYPMVDKMEKSLFNTTYKNENIYSRLDRLEETTFGKVSSEDLNTRVDKLSALLAPKKRIDPEPAYNQYQDMDTYYNSGGLDAVNDQSFPFQLATVEEDILNSSYQNDNNANRLNRLENKLFGRNFPTDSDITRLQRIMVASEAKKDSHKYENNRRMQKMATASQLGGILLMILAMLL